MCRLHRGTRRPHQRHRGEPDRRLCVHVLIRRVSEDMEAGVRAELAHPDDDAQVPAVAGERAGAKRVVGQRVLPLLGLVGRVHQLLGEGEDVGTIQPWRAVAGAQILGSVSCRDREAGAEWIGRHDD